MSQLRSNGILRQMYQCTLYVKMNLISQQNNVTDLLKKVSTPLFVSDFSAQTARESINIVNKSLTIGLLI